MKKFILMLVLGLFLMGVVSAGHQMEREVTGQSCGRYMTLNSDNQNYETVNMVWYNLDWSCKCNQNSEKIPIWLPNPDGGLMMGHTCRVQ